MTGMEVSYFGALGAGALSFLSPCVLPLVQIVSGGLWKWQVPVYLQRFVLLPTHYASICGFWNPGEPFSTGLNRLLRGLASSGRVS